MLKKDCTVFFSKRKFDSFFFVKKKCNFLISFLTWNTFFVFFFFFFKLETLFFQTWNNFCLFFYFFKLETKFLPFKTWKTFFFQSWNRIFFFSWNTIFFLMRHQFCLFLSSKRQKREKERIEYNYKKKKKNSTRNNSTTADEKFCVKFGEWISSYFSKM